MSTAPPSPQAPAANLLDPKAIRPITLPILISALANLLAGYLWFFASCFGIFLSAPMLVLAAFEIWTFVRAPQLQGEDLIRRATVLGLFELLVGVFNLVSLICGTVVLLGLGKVRARIGAAPRHDGS
ncbi:MAG TPA: hypothetical protein VMV46_01990 [Thermoanaerobaculia bacterium]|nr:hypothetical protein [Thermoanaerobaculia bacterium]